MPFATKLIAIVVAVASAVSALPNVDTPVSVVARSAQDFNVGNVWTEANKGGTPGGLNVKGIPSGCKNFTPAFTDIVTSIQISSGFLCDFFVDPDCRGRSVTVQNGAFAPTLQGTNFDNNLASYACYAS